MNASKEKLGKAMQRFRARHPVTCADNSALLRELWACPEWTDFTRDSAALLCKTLRAAAAASPRGAGGKVLSEFQGLLDGAFLIGYRTRELIEPDPAPEPKVRVI